MKNLMIIAAFMAICSSLFAQGKAVITFKETSHNFGTFEEELGKVSTEFEFTNTGTAPLLITRTAASCGCTTPEYPQEPIAPGKTGVIKVTYNAKGRPGSFQKTVYVFANTEPEKTSLIIKGNVTPHKVTKEDTYPRQIGLLRMKDKNVAFFDVYPGIPKTQSISVMNDSEGSMNLSFYDVPKHLKIKMVPETLKPGAEGRIEITYFAEKAKDWGRRRDEFKIDVTGIDRDESSNKITLQADIREDFSKWSDMELENAPRFNTDSKVIDFGIIKEKQIKIVKIKNSGKSDLVIRTVKNDSKMLSIDIDRTTVAPGKSADLKITASPEKADDNFLNNLIYIISNDPESPSSFIKVLGSVGK